MEDSTPSQIKLYSNLYRLESIDAITGNRVGSSVAPRGHVTMLNSYELVVRCHMQSMFIEPRLQIWYNAYIPSSVIQTAK